MRAFFWIYGLLLALSAHAQTSGAGNPIGEVHSPDASLRGSVELEKGGASVMSGTQITAGNSTADIKLARGGTLDTCPHSSIIITSGDNGKEMLVALNNGSIETNYELGSNADTVITPDFRLLLAGPGLFRFAIATYPRGDMCVQSLAGNTSSIIVNEQFGEGTNQVKPGEQIIFHAGHVDNSASNTGESCGCPVPITLPPSTRLSFPEQQSRGAEQAVASGKEPPREQPLPIPASQAIKPGQTYTEIDAPIVFHGQDLPPAQPSLAAVKLEKWPEGLLAPQASPPPAKKRWYQRFGSALTSLFGGRRRK